MIRQFLRISGPVTTRPILAVSNKQAKLCFISTTSAIMHRAPQAMVSRPAPDNLSINVPRDPNTLSNYNNWLTTHIAVDFNIDFDKKLLRGNVKLSLRSVTESETNEIILDTSYLKIDDIKVGNKAAKWELASSRVEPYGSPLAIKLEHGIKKDDIIQLDIDVSTTDECTALQWLTPAQTSNGKYPYMFSQCQPIHTRAIFPCQDTPDVKAPVDFRLRSALPVVASGLPDGIENIPGSSDKIYKFKQKVPLPSYLFAVASGDIVGAPIGPRSTVWTGPDELEACKWELEEDTENFLKVAEKLVYPYAWGTYNVLVLPPSFPYGGMENPMYTFATPTIISGDRQNVDVIAHELSHSWSGNLVTSASWEHFWLNEGWTTYLERRIQGALHGEPSRDFSAIIGWKALQDSVKNFGEDHEFTKMIPNLKGKDPDDAFSSVPYEKGSTFLYHLEKLISKEKWDKFIPHYFETYKFKSLDSYDFRSTLTSFFAGDAAATKIINDLDWDTWFYKPGFPPKPNFDTSMADVCYALASKWESLSHGDSSTSASKFTPQPSDIKNWVSNQSVVFLETLQNSKTPLRAALIPLMGETYGYTTSNNVELSSRFFVLGFKAKAPEVVQPTAKLLGKVGRMKFVRPLYRHLRDMDEKLAKETFQKNKEFYHPICRKIVEKDLYGDK